MAKNPLADSLSLEDSGLLRDVMELSDSGGIEAIVAAAGPAASVEAPPRPPPVPAKEPSEDLLRQPERGPGGPELAPAGLVGPETSRSAPPSHRPSSAGSSTLQKAGTTSLLAGGPKSPRGSEVADREPTLSQGAEGRLNTKIVSMCDRLWVKVSELDDTLTLLKDKTSSHGEALLAMADPGSMTSPAGLGKAVQELRQGVKEKLDATQRTVGELSSLAESIINQLDAHEKRLKAQEAQPLEDRLGKISEVGEAQAKVMKASLAEVERKLQERVADLEGQFRKDLAAAKAEFSETGKSLKQGFDQQAAELKTALEASLQRVSETSKPTSDRPDPAVTLGKELADLRAMVIAQRQEMSQVGAKLQELNAAAEGSGELSKELSGLREATSQLQARSDALEAKLQKDVLDLQKSLAGQGEALRQDLEQLQLASSTASKGSSDEIVTNLAQVKKELLDLKTGSAAESQSLRQVAKEQQERLAAFGNDLEKTTTVLSQLGPKLQEMEQATAQVGQSLEATKASQKDIPGALKEAQELLAKLQGAAQQQGQQVASLQAAAAEHEKQLAAVQAGLQEQSQGLEGMKAQVQDTKAVSEKLQKLDAQVASVSEGLLPLQKGLEALQRGLGSFVVQEQLKPLQQQLEQVPQRMEDALKQQTASLLQPIQQQQGQLKDLETQLRAQAAQLSQEVQEVDRRSSQRIKEADAAVVVVKEELAALQRADRRALQNLEERVEASLKKLGTEVADRIEQERRDQHAACSSIDRFVKEGLESRLGTAERRLEAMDMRQVAAEAWQVASQQRQAAHEQRLEAQAEALHRFEDRQVYDRSQARTPRTPPRDDMSGFPPEVRFWARPTPVLPQPIASPVQPAWLEGQVWGQQPHHMAAFQAPSLMPAMIPGALHQ